MPKVVVRLRRSNFDKAMLDELVKSQKVPVIVIPAFAGVTALEPFYEAIKLVLDKSYDDTWNVSVLPIKMTEL